MKRSIFVKMATFLSAILLLATASVSYGQTRRIAGTVVDEDGTPLAGVYVLASGTRVGATTDAEGRYSFEVPDSAPSLEFTLLGMRTEAVTIGSQSRIDVTMKPGSIGLDESVVVGYGTMIRKELSSSVASVKNEQLNERGSAIALAQSMAGKMAGVNVVSTSGRPGGYTQITVRGIGSLNSDTHPIYVVDGVVDVDPAVINSSDVEKIDVLKDAAATSIYGARGSNGVIMITTRQGRSGDATVTFDTKTGVNFLARRLDMMNSEQYMQMIKMAYEYDGEIMPHLLKPNEKLFIYEMNADGSYKTDAQGLLIATPRYDTDWQSEAYRTALITTNSLSFSQGNEKTQVYASLSYSDLQGILKTTWQKHMTGNIKMHSQIKPWLAFNAAVMAGHEAWNANDKEWAMDNGASRTAYEMTPIIPVTYPDGTPGRWNDYFTSAEPKDNPITQLTGITDICTTNHMLANGGLDFTLAPGLVLTVNGSYNVRARRYDYFAKQGINNASVPYNRASIEHQDITRWTNEDYLTYNHTFFGDRLKSNFVLGASWYEYEYRMAKANASNIPTESFMWNNLATATELVAPASGYDKQTMNSFYFRTNQVLLGRYMFGLTLRTDGASVFGANKKYGFFPAASFAWDVAQEPWFEPARKVFDTMKFRLSYGVVGNSSIGSYNSLAQYSSGTSIFANQLNPYVILNNLGNGDLTWESTEQYDAGLDLGLWGNRVQIIADWYLKNNRRLLYDMPVPWTTGYESSMGNIGTLQNVGFELTLNTHNIDRPDFKWDTDFIFSTNRTRCIDLQLEEGQYIDAFGGRVYEGYEWGTLYAYNRIGTWGLDEVEEAARYGRVPGEIKYRDVNGDSVIDDNDRVYVGTTIPRFELSLVNTFNWKGLTFMFDLGSLLGYKVLSYTAHLLQSSSCTTNMTPDILNAWTPDNQNTMWPALTTKAHAYNKSQPDDFDVQDGDFLRLRTVSLSYDLKKTLLRNVAFFKGLHIGVTGENVYLWTRYKGGYDPETGWGGGGLGSDWYAYPRPMTVTGNLRLTF
jgi:TonB-linked SusC/RagA family outer membrane protein